MALILVIETSTEICSVSLIKDGILLDLIESDQGQNHARLVTVFAEDLLSRNNLQPGELNAVAISKGPGSYTGLRIGSINIKRNLLRRKPATYCCWDSRSNGKTCCIKQKTVRNFRK